MYLQAQEVIFYLPSQVLSVLVKFFNLLIIFLAKVGAKGGVMALANVMPRECVALVNLYKKKQYDIASQLQAAIIPLNQAITRGYGTV